MSSFSGEIGRSLLVSGYASATSGVGRAMDYFGNWAMPNAIISPESARMLRRFQIGTDERYRNILNKHGFDTLDSGRLNIQLTSLDSWRERGVLDVYPHWLNGRFTAKEWELMLTQYTPNITEVLTMLNRQLITPQLAKTFCMLGTEGDIGLSEVFMQLRYEIPGPSDLVRFAVREAFTPSIVNDYQYAKETPINVFPWMEKQGYGQEIGINIPANATDQNGNPHSGKATWSDLYWWSHWELPSVSQGYEMLRRLYLESPYGKSPDLQHETDIFTEDDMSKLLRVSDYPQYWRSKLIAIQYLPYQKRDIQRMHALGVFKDSDVYHAFRAIGYDDKRAQQLTELIKKLTQQANEKAHAKFKSTLCKYYTAGLMDREDVQRYGKRLGMESDDIDLTLSLCDLDTKLKEQKMVISQLKKAYFGGVFTETDIQQGLAQAEVKGSVANRLINRWRLMRNYSYKWVSASQAINWFKDGIMNESDTYARLINLGIHPTDSQRAINEAKLSLLKQQNKLIQKQQKAQQSDAQKQQKQQQTDMAKQAKAATQAAKDKAKLLEKRLNRMLSAFTDSNIRKWAKLHLIDEATVKTILEEKGWDKKAIDAMLQETGLNKPTPTTA